MTATAWTEQDSHNLTVALVAEDGHHMRLHGRARRDAIALMAANSVPVEQMADRLGLTVEALRLSARRFGIALPSRQIPYDWWVIYVEPSRAIDHKRSKREQRRETAGASR